MNPRLYVDADFNPTLHARLIRLSYPFTRMSNIRTRWEFPHVLNALGLKNEGVEVGVMRGSFSDYILRTWKGRKLYSVDPYRSFPDSGYVDCQHFDDPTFEEIFQATSKRLSNYGARSEMVRLASPRPPRRAASPMANSTLSTSTRNITTKLFETIWPHGGPRSRAAEFSAATIISTPSTAPAFLA